jgi:hypothetical protein
VTELVVTVLAASAAPFGLALLSSPRLGPFSTAVSEWTVFVAEFGASLSSFGGCALIRTYGRAGGRTVSLPTISSAWLTIREMWPSLEW